MPTKSFLIILVAFGAMLGSVGQLFFKLGSAHLSADPLSWFTNWRIIIGLALYAIATLVFLWALRYGNLSLLYPIVATSYVWVVLLSSFVLGEAFPWFKWFGIGAILGGVLIIAL